MNEICQIANGIVSARYFVFSLTGLLSFLGLVGAYIYTGPIKMLIHRILSIIASVFGLIGAGIIGGLIFISNFIC